MIKNIDVEIDGNTLLVMTITLKDRNIVCIPTMIGCPVRCDFCISSKSDFKRNLVPIEMIHLFGKGYEFANPENPTMLSFTGEGEPFLNVKNVNVVISTLENDKRVQGYRIVTSGIKSRLVSKIRDSIKPIDLQFSMHSTNDKDRKELIQYTDELSVIVENIEKFENRFNEVAVNYVLMSGVNDTENHLREFFDIVPRNWLIKLNPLIAGTPKYQKSQRTEYWGKCLEGAGFNIKVFSKIGSTISNNFYNDLTYRKAKGMIVSGYA